MLLQSNWENSRTILLFKHIVCLPTRKIFAKLSEVELECRLGQGGLFLEAPQWTQPPSFSTWILSSHTRWDTLSSIIGKMTHMPPQIWWQVPSKLPKSPSHDEQETPETGGFLVESTFHALDICIGKDALAVWVQDSSTGAWPPKIINIHIPMYIQ